MVRELGSSQISALLESVPGIANVLRSPVADALVAMIRAGARIDEFSLDSAKELVQYAIRRGLINAGEGERLLAEVSAASAKRRGKDATVRHSKPRRGTKASRQGVHKKPKPRTARKPGRGTSGKKPTKKSTVRRKRR